MFPRSSASRHFRTLAFLLQAALIPSAVLAADEWKTLELTAEFWAEGAGVGDVNRDGHPDILSGPFWYAGPGFQGRHEIYPATQSYAIRLPDGSEQTVPGFRGVRSGKNEYSDNFLSFTHDLNGDGWIDYIVVGHPGRETVWYENPQGGTGAWKKHLAFAATDNESPQFVDLTGDGAPELLCMHQSAVGFARPDPAHPERPWSWHPAAENPQWQWNTHGLGYGDVNGDGRIDILTAQNWWEQPTNGSGATNVPWKKHDAIFNNGGAHMAAYDVNGDGRNDVVTAWEGHGFGLLWHEQTVDTSATWTRHVIMGVTSGEREQGVSFSQPHALAFVDMNGDGLRDIVTGKRIWAHGPTGDVEANGPAVLYWFELKRENGLARFQPHLIHRDSGVGTQVVAADVNGDGKPDVIAGNKKGLFVHLQP